MFSFKEYFQQPQATEGWAATCDVTEGRAISQGFVGFFLGIATLSQNALLSLKEKLELLWGEKKTPGIFL